MNQIWFLRSACCCHSRLIAGLLSVAVIAVIWAPSASAQVVPVSGTITLVNTNPLPLIGNDVAYDPANGVYLGVIGHGEIFGAFATKTGDLISSFRIGAANRSSPYGQYPRCAYSPKLNNGQGGFLVTWHQNDGAVSYVHSVVVAYPTGVISADTVISDGSQGGSFGNSGAAIAYSATSQRFLVSWTTVPPAWGTQGRFVDGATGTPFGPAMQLVDATTTGGSSHPAVAWNAATDEFGLAYAAWGSAGAFIGFKRIRATDGALSAPTSFGFGAGTFSPGIAVHPVSQNYLVGWSVGAGSLSIEFDAAGPMIGAPQLLSTRVGTPASFSLAMNPVSGTSLAVSEDTLSYEVAGIELDAAGGPIGVAGPLTSGSTASWVPRVTARTDAKEWNISSSRHRVTLANQIVATGSAGGVAPKPLTVSVAADKATPIVEGTSLTWTATPAGGTGPIQYQFWRYSPATGWVVAQEYSASNTYTWAPTAGTHAVQVWARNSGSTASYDAYAATGTFTVTAAAARITSFSSNVPFPSLPNVTATFTATATGAGSIEYKFWRLQGGTWSVVQDWSALNSFTWIVSEGTYALQVWVRRVGSGAQYEDWRGTNLFTVASLAAKLSGLSANVPLPASPATTITWTAVGSGGSSTLEYKFWLYRVSTGTWSVLRDWGAGNQASWTPGPSTGQHAIQVWIRSAGFTGTFEDWKGSDFFNITASTGLTLTSNISLAGLRESAAQPVTWTAQMAPAGAWEYQFWTFSSKTGVWTLQRAYAGESTFTWFPPAGTNVVQVWARQAGTMAKFERWASTNYFVVNP